ncbi:MAG: transglutaminase-like cysteine peptidase [Geminicoccaceae bacterium]|nr:transglutaminase-like cysteine peptidase [Geminicoccaceae bacterium]
MRSTIRGLVVASTLLAAASAAQAVEFGLFGTREFRAASFAGLPQWRSVLERVEAERPLWRRCALDPKACPNRATAAWRALLKGLEGASLPEQMRAINRFANQFRYRPDDRNWGRSDHWATPVEFLERSGDCEDYAILKYLSLRELGVPAQRMRMVVLRDTLRDLAHAVLAVHDGEQVWILDNVTDAVLRHDRLGHYVPYYSVNEEARWAHLPIGATLTARIDPRLLLGEGVASR